jgi:hypothetical protein
MSNIAVICGNRAEFARWAANVKSARNAYPVCSLADAQALSGMKFSTVHTIGHGSGLSDYQEIFNTLTREIPSTVTVESAVSVTYNQYPYYAMPKNNPWGHPNSIIPSPENSPWQIAPQILTAKQERRQKIDRLIEEMTLQQADQAIEVLETIAKMHPKEPKEMQSQEPSVSDVVNAGITDSWKEFTTSLFTNSPLKFRP